MGAFEVIHKNKNNEIIKIEKLRPNLITDAGLNLLRDALKGEVTDIEIKYVALGSNSTAPAVDQTILISEEFRKEVTEQINDPLTAGKLYTEVYIADAEANDFEINEIGWFAGSATSSTINTGTLIARVLYNFQKDNATSMIIRRVDTFKRG